MKNVYDLVVEMEAIEKERDEIIKFLEKSKTTVDDLIKLEQLEIRYNEIDNILIEKEIKFNVYKYKEAKEDLNRWETMTGFSALLAIPKDYSSIRNEKKNRLAIITNDLKSIVIE
ncbi:hypothetical protein [uncultured Clostridium sp.]|uniref:hypothetical protein n=1 Tax=uncultured Clostridium sp. TaxID=59620 RepID=UPI0025E69F4A|nr:hypothetical protein [uncultured Clostridium sp.]